MNEWLTTEVRILETTVYPTVHSMCKNQILWRISHLPHTFVPFTEAQPMRHPLRDTWRKPKAVWRAETIDQEKLKATMEEIEPKIQELEALAAEYEARIYAAAKPVPRKYKIVRVEE
jgi:hypothetical protein